MEMGVLSSSFYLRENVVAIAEDLIGISIFSYIDGKLTGGVITETEAYCGLCDRACHAYGRKTPRTKPMYEEGGIAYIYQCYGLHFLLNIVTNHQGHADAVLVRKIFPTHGIDIMKQRRKFPKTLISGPATVAQALGLDLSLNGESLASEKLWLTKKKKRVEKPRRLQRIGIDYAGWDKNLPWRFSTKMV